MGAGAGQQLVELLDDRARGEIALGLLQGGKTQHVAQAASSRDRTAFSTLTCST